MKNLRFAILRSCEVGKVLTYRLFISACLALSLLGCWTTTAPPRVKKEFFAAYERDQRPIDLTFRMVDQDGLGARNFRFKVDLSRLHKFLGLVRYTREECHEVTTDEEGVVHLSMPGKKASYISFKEVDIGRYVFSKGLRNLGEVPIGKFTDVLDRADLKVVQHGPAQALKEIHPYQRVTEAEEENIFTLAPQDGVLSSGAANDGVLIVVSNARKANAAQEEKLSAYKDEKRVSVDVVIKICLEGIHGYEIQEAPDEVVSFAPLSGYHQEMAKQFAVSERSSLPVGFFLRNRQEGTYYWYQLSIGIGGGEVVVGVEGRSGPPGSNNLYQDVWPDKRAFEAWSKRCP